MEWGRNEQQRINMDSRIDTIFSEQVIMRVCLSTHKRGQSEHLSKTEIDDIGEKA